MVARMFALGLAPASATQPATVEALEATPTAQTPATASDAPSVGPSPIPWSVLKNRRLVVTTKDGAAHQGVLLGVDHGAAILENDDGTLASIATADVTNVRTSKTAPPPAEIPSPFGAPASLAFRDDDYAAALQTRDLQLAVTTRRAAVAGVIISSLSAFSSIVAEGFNVKRWALAKRVCGESYYYGGAEVCGWTDGDDEAERPYSYTYYENLTGIATASTIALPLHAAGGLTMFIPSTMLRRRADDDTGRRRHLAAWALWGAGMVNLVANQTVAWTQLARTEMTCDPQSTDAPECDWVTPTRGAPPTMYLLSAGLSVSSAILGLLDARGTADRVERAAAAKRTPAISLFPFRIQRGGGLGVAGRF